MEKIEENSIKVFISYSWKPLSNKVKVINLAERLTNDGIHVIIDDWDLKEGQDKYHFMEKMVTDKSVNKVLLICNKEYVEKANNKFGGVGIESLIVSDDIYNETDQTKFIPVVMEYENGKACMPTFVKTRIYIDLSKEDVYEENYENLIRNLYNKPLSKRPPIGKMPIHLRDENPIYLPTAHKVSTIKSSLINNKENTTLLIKDYLDTFIESLLNFKLDISILNAENIIEKVEKSIIELQPLKNDFIEFLQNVVKYSSIDYTEIFISFFENLLQFYEDNDLRLDSGNGLNDLANDNFRFFNYDLFLSFSNILILNERFDLLASIVQSDFIVTRNWNKKAEVTNFHDFRKYNYILNEYKNKSINPKRVSVVADLIKQYATILKFEHLNRTDLILFYASLFYPTKTPYSEKWFPETSCYNSYQFEVFPKIISKRYFDKIKVLFEAESVNDLKTKIDNLKEKDNIQERYHNIPSIKNAFKYDEMGMYK